MTHLVNPTNGAIFLLLFGALSLIGLTMLHRRRETPLHTREVTGLQGLEREIQRAAESASPVHIALGSGGLSSGDTITSLAGLQALEGLVDAAVAYEVPPIVTVGHPTLLPLAQDVLRRAYERRGATELYDPDQVRFVAPSPLAYSAGANTVGAPENTTASIAAGAYGSDVSLLADSSERRHMAQWAAADSAEAMGALYPATDRLAVGEELYAIGAQVTGKDKYITSLITEDILRFLVVAAILGAAVLALVTS